MNPTNKYKAFPSIELEDRKWPSRQITEAPIWCSVDLRDGNQSLAIPMTVSQKTKMFLSLVKCGFKEIEVGFPAASPTEFEFVRHLIEEDLIPSDVTIQVLVQAREDLIIQTVKSLRGVRKAIIHLYNSTSPAQRRVVFGLEKSDIVKMAIQGTKWVKEYSSKLYGTEIIFQYSPESFSATEVDFALEVCEAVMDIWQPTVEKKMIINLPDTVQVAMPNIYADQIEWFCRNMARRDCVVISVHTHNDRGTGVAATELGILAGADRVEGTLFGNGERTGNLDIIIVALNLFTQGIDPGLDFTNIDSLRGVYECCTNMTVPQRHPYSGELVFTAFSGSHQDAIRKGLNARESENSIVWDVPYLGIDPKDIGRRYDEVIRVNGQSGKGGVAYLLENECNIHLPKDMVREFGVVAGKEIDALCQEVTADDLRKMLWKEYIEKKSPHKLLNFYFVDDVKGCSCTALIESDNNERIDLSGTGNGPIDAFVNSLRTKGIADISVINQFEHALSEGAEAEAIAYVQVRFADGSIKWGAGVDNSTPLASVRAVISALNR
ncbi:MAG: 2-isopropylmalate synthase [bacterium]